MMELGAMVKTEEYEGYGKMNALSCRTVCEWWYQITDHYNFDREVVYVALNYFIRYSRVLMEQSNDSITTDMQKKIAIASLYVAIKVHSTGEEDVVDARTRALSRLLFGYSEPRDILDMEKDMLQALDWRLNPPTMHQFAYSYSQLHPLCKTDTQLTDYLFEMTRYQVELAIFYPELMMNYKSSVIAYAAMLRVEEVFNDRVLPSELREKFLSLQSTLNADPSHVQEAMFAIETLIPNLPDYEEYMRMLLPNRGDRDGTNGSISPNNVAGF